MKAYLDCYPCFFKQALSASRMVTDDEKVIWSVLNEVGGTLPGIPLGATPPELGREVYRIIVKKTGVIDPFRLIKKDCIQRALSLVPRVKKHIEDSEDRLRTAVKVAIAGNVIDFGANAAFDLEEDILGVLNQELRIDHFEEFKQACNEANKILYIADNAGETVFDRLLIEELDRPVVYVVREKPIINDATREDAVRSGIDHVAEIVSSGCDAPGNILKFCSDPFIKIYKKADLIISKGQGNYEGLSDEARPIFFLLKAKCQVIARDIGVEEGSIILKKAKTGFA